MRLLNVLLLCRSLHHLAHASSLGRTQFPGDKDQLALEIGNKEIALYFQQDLQPLFHFPDSFFKILGWEVFFEFAKKCLYSLAAKRGISLSLKYSCLIRRAMEYHRGREPAAAHQSMRLF